MAFGAQASRVDIDLTADLLVIPSAVSTNDATLFMALRNVVLVSHTPNSQPELDEVAAQAGATGMLLGLAAGRVKEIRLAPDLSPLTVGIYREVGSRLQFVHGLPGKTEYAAEEYDATGRYTANYAQVEGSSTRYHKTKVVYAGSLASNTQLFFTGGKMIPQVAASEAEITLSPDGRPVFVRARDEIDVSGAQNPVHSKTTITLTALAPVPGQAHDWATISSHLVRLAADEVFAPKVANASVDDARIHGLTYEKVIERMTALAGAPGGIGGPTPTDPSARAAHEAVVQESSGLFTALAAIFRQKPETVARALTAIRNQSALTDTLIDALGSSGVSAAHEALASIIRTKTLDARVHRRALTALARTSNPSDASVETLESLLRDDPFSESALYGLGTQSRRLRDAGKSEQAGKIAELLRDRIRMAGNDQSHLRVALTAIMNCGCDQALPAVTPFLTDERELMRAVAVRALQSMRDPQIDGLIASRLSEDSASAVKIAAMDAARVREPADAITGVLTKVATTDADPRVRYRGVDLLLTWLPKRSDLRSTLAQVAAKDPEPQVRARAQAAL